jgi:flagellar basal-body rod protein FlgF
MENAQLISLSRQVALQRQMDVVANNIANLNTSGFKAEDLLFEEYKMPVARDRAFAFVDQQLSYTQDWATAHDMSQGAMVQTGNPLDVALEGEGFLTVQTPAGERYTRSGSLVVNSEGTLVDLAGNEVLGDGGPITFTAADTDINIGRDGTISSSQGIKGKLAVVEFANPQELARDGSNLWSGGTPQPAAATRIMQGSIEKSNVSGISEIAQMIRVQRSYQSVASLISQQDDLRRNAIQRLGSLSA